MDSLSTQNLSGQTNRLQLGAYTDPQLGTVRAETYAQIRPVVISTIVPDNAIFDSLVLQLRYDFYLYGAPGETLLDFTVHELTEEINNELIFYSKSQVAYDPTPLGSGSTLINATYFKQELEDTDADSVMKVRIKLDPAYGQKLLDAINPEDENYTNFNLFKSIFKGFAIIPQQADKIVGISNDNVNSVLTLYYHSGETKYTSLYSLSQGINFTNISTNRSGTELESLNQFYSDFSPASNRYIQAGGSLVTKLDFSKYYEYIDTIPQLLLNSVELNIENQDVEEQYPLNKSLALAMLTDNNRYKVLKNQQDTLDYISFGGMAVFGIIANPDLTRSLFAATDQGDLLQLQYSETNKAYRSYPTLFFQKLIALKEKKYPYWALISSNPGPGKAVNRTRFSKDNIKLKIYYTRPKSNENQ